MGMVVFGGGWLVEIGWLNMFGLVEKRCVIRVGLWIGCGVLLLDLN